MSAGPGTVRSGMDMAGFISPAGKLWRLTEWLMSGWWGPSLKANNSIIYAETGSA